jgi:hypothetical protein
MADTLKEYLIALGFKVDEAGWKGFNDKLQRSTAHAAELGAATVGAAAEIGVAVERLSKKYEDLFYVSQRTGSAVGALKAFEFSARQIGLTAADGRSAVEGFASAMRGNPGVKSMFAGMGVDVNDSEKGVGQLVDRLKTMPFFLAKAYGEMAGLDEHTLVQLIANRDKQIAQEKLHLQIQKDAGINAQKYAQDSVRFNDKLRLTEERWAVLGDRVAISWLPVAEKVVDLADRIGVVFTSVDKSTNGWAGQVASLTLALGGTYKALSLIMRLLGIGGAAGAAGLGMRGMALRLLGPVGAFAWGLGLGGEANANEAPLMGRAHPSDVKGGNAAAAVEFYKSRGWTPEQAAGIAANLHSESAMNPRAVGDGGSAYGLAQWHPDRQADFARWAGKDIRDSTLQEQMEFVHYELTQGKERLAGNALRAARSAREAGSTVSRMYERPADVLGAASNRGAMADTILSSPGAASSVTISHKTENNITGVSDPQKAASLVNDAQRRVNGDIVRNTRSAFE